MQTTRLNEIDFISHPITTLSGDISVPGDKSISHRAIILGAIAKGNTIITGFLAGEDCLATIKAFRAMGVTIQGPFANKVNIQGVGKYGLKRPEAPLDCGNSGTSMRLLAGLLAAQPFNSVLIGDQSLQKRPMERITIPLSQMKAKIKTLNGRPPLFIQGNPDLKGIHYSMPLASAQVKSCLLLAGLYAEGKTTVTEPAITRDHTERMLKTFNYPVHQQGPVISLTSKGNCIGTHISVPGDMSSAAFFIVAATLIPGATLWIRNVGINPSRIGVIDILKKMGAQITITNQQYYGEEPIADLYIEPAELTGITIPPNLVSLAIDEFPIIFIAAACAKGITHLEQAQELRVKESDRITAMATGLKTLGIEVHTVEEGITIKGGCLQGGEVDSFNDHRIAMSFAIAGAVAKAPIRIKNCNPVATSFPTFIQLANTIKLSIIVDKANGY